LGRFYERARLSSGGSLDGAPAVLMHPFELAEQEVTLSTRELMGNYLEEARLMGQRTAELHLALNPETEDPDFAAEPFTDFYRQGLYHGMVALANRVFRLLSQQLRLVPQPLQETATMILAHESAVVERFRKLRDTRIRAARIRQHGDYHLGQILCTGNDFVIIDFEGEPARPLGERRMKRSPLRDVAGMLRSFHYASLAARFNLVAGVIVHPGTDEKLKPWSRFWYHWASASFLKGYFATAERAPFIPPDRGELKLLLDVFVLEKAVYELGYELNNRPDWVGIPLDGIADLLAPDT